MLFCFWLMVILVMEAATVGCMTYTHTRRINSIHGESVKEVLLIASDCFSDGL